MNMESSEFIIQKNDDRKYVGTIYETSISSYDQHDDAIKFDNKECAIAVALFLTRRSGREFSVIERKITFEKVMGL